MKIKITREFVCAADDQTNESETSVFVADGQSLEDVLLKILELKFLQYSSSHRCLVARANNELALVIPEDKKIILLVNPQVDAVSQLDSGHIHFSFDLTRVQEQKYSEYRRANF